MTKTENRAAARAFREEQEAKRREQIRQDAAKADLEELGKLRRYLVTGQKSRVDASDLLNAIDDFAEKLTGDRTALHSKSSSIG
jgi:acetyl-CoA carboxylase alpha subunit